MSKDRFDETGKYGITDAGARGPRFILYLFLAILVLIAIPDIGNNQTALLIIMLVGGPMIAFLCWRAWPYRELFRGIARLVVETGLVFGVGITLVAVVQAIGPFFGIQLGG